MSGSERLKVLLEIGNRLFEVNQCATISPQEPASVNRLRQFSSESFPPRKWQILAFLVVFLSWRSPPLPPERSCREMSGAALPEGQFAPSHCKHAVASPLCAQAGGPRGALKHSPPPPLLCPALGQGLPAPGRGWRRTRRNVGVPYTRRREGKTAQSLYCLVKDSRRLHGHPVLSL